MHRVHVDHGQAQLNAAQDLGFTMDRHTESMTSQGQISNLSPNGLKDHGQAQLRIV